MDNYESMVFYSSFYEGIKDIPDDMPELKLQLYDAILTYGLYDIEMELDWQLKTAWRQIKAQIDANNKRRENGQKGGLQKAKNRAKQSEKDDASVVTCSKVVAPRSNRVANVNVNVNENENVYVNNNGNGNVNNACSPAVELNDAVNYYLDYINPAPSHSLIQAIEGYINDGMTDECLIAIFEYCIDNNKTNWAYIRSAVEGCFKDGIRTLDDYKRSRAARERAKSEMQTYEPKTKDTTKKSSFHNFEEREYESDLFDNIYFEETFGLKPGEVYKP